MNKTLVHFLCWSFLASAPAFAQEPIQIEIDSAPVEIEIQEPVRTPEPVAEIPPGMSAVGWGGVALGALVAGALVLGGGGGGSGGGSATQH